MGQGAGGRRPGGRGQGAVIGQVCAGGVGGGGSGSRPEVGWWMPVCLTHA